MDPVHVTAPDGVNPKHLCRLWAEAMLDVEEYHPMTSEYGTRGCFMSARMKKLQADIDTLAKQGYKTDRYNSEPMRALHGLTPGGSEFAGDPATCVAYIKRELQDHRQALKDRVFLRRALEQCRDALVPNGPYVAEKMRDAYRAAIKLVGRRR